MWTQNTLNFMLRCEGTVSSSIRNSGLVQRNTRQRDAHSHTKAINHLVLAERDLGALRQEARVVHVTEQDAVRSRRGRPGSAPEASDHHEVTRQRPVDLEEPSVVHPHLRH